MKIALRLALVPLMVSCLLLVATPRPASAHPLGNFTINHYSALTVSPGKVDVNYVLDMAEIPTYQELGTIRPDHSTDLTPQQRATYAAQEAALLIKGQTLSLDGQPLPLTLVGDPVLSFLPGAGGLPTLRLVMNLTAPLGSTQKGALAYRDDNYAERIGWKEIIAKPGNGIALAGATVPSTDLSAALTQYPPERLNDPLRVTAASFSFAPGAGGASTQQLQAAQKGLEITMPWAQKGADALTNLINQKDLPFSALLLGLLIAFGAGAAHALSPGHGKTVVAAYLVGSRGTAFHALLLGVTVTVSHTIGVFLLGLVVLYASEYILPDQLYPWLGFGSGVMIAVVGITLFLQRRRAWRRAGKRLPGLPTRGVPAQPALVAAVHDHDPRADQGHDHDHDHAHDHDHDHVSGHDHSHGTDHDHVHDHVHAAGHTHDHDAATPHAHGLFSRPHTHVAPDGQHVSLGSLLALGITGGIIPCPSALIVLLAAVAYHQVGLGLVLILAFSLGLAGVLVGIGMIMVYGRGLLGRVRFNLNTSLLSRLPMASALAVSCLGLLIAFEALSAGGLLR